MFGFRFRSQCLKYFICCRFISDESSIYRRHFLSFCAFSTLLAACVATGVGLFLGFTGDTKRRISPCIVVLVLMFIIQVLFAIFDAKDASGVFLCVTILNIVIIGAFIGLYISSIFGVASYFPDKYANAIVVGTSIGILLAVISRIIAKEKSYFVDALLQMVVCRLVEPHLSPTAAVMLHLFVFFGAISGVVNSVFYRYIIIL
ncbi:unnamed protein product [Didymodactylos carnosus]|uniref:Uncharacterized protein n=1 Tax=Didymodactylos carnosus TaxID=1234261 RepID=A0A813XDM6_9BILA|nr:unnamed protein product [Didymodactylos carnosus]CAF0944928.1 unnamed protein product [Didymodactylos carnosus]CAF3650882.1 unnamed protein product [Didymodactylos carnosus]CAF3719627.1 unnamed protein product [Didymodactylos carnosus]